MSQYYDNVDQQYDKSDIWSNQFKQNKQHYIQASDFDGLPVWKPGVSAGVYAGLSKFGIAWMKK